MSVPECVGSKGMFVGDIVTPNDYPLTFDEVTHVTAIFSCNHVEQFWTLGTYAKGATHYCTNCYKDVEFNVLVIGERPSANHYSDRVYGQHDGEEIEYKHSV